MHIPSPTIHTLQEETAKLKARVLELEQALRDVWDDPDHMSEIIDRALKDAIPV